MTRSRSRLLNPRPLSVLDKLRRDLQNKGRYSCSLCEGRELPRAASALSERGKWLWRNRERNRKRDLETTLYPIWTKISKSFQCRHGSLPRLHFYESRINDSTLLFSVMIHDIWRRYIFHNISTMRNERRINIHSLARHGSKHELFETFEQPSILHKLELFWFRTCIISLFGGGVELYFNDWRFYEVWNPNESHDIIIVL